MPQFYTDALNLHAVDSPNILLYAKIVQSDIYLSSLFVNSLCSYNSEPHAWTQYHLIGALVCGHNMAGVIFNMYEMYRTLTQECLLFI